ncbi:hypothetical protein ROTAS13_01795 [Roseomonas sp. TAS13]|uniref:AAA family ATPase n=1 Tax=Roseomonas sp. TAS13 TaxID=1926319 RepID=UPI0009698C02|nr:AAA family ATPase [Roseomonas sp. TAS13]GAV34133.1 hypothetical protein ROTAS13_01795 [Roseomonas sp. TAS13]
MSASEVPAFLQTPANKFDIAIAQSTLDFFEPNAKWNLRTFDDNKSRNKKNLIRTKSNVRPSDCERELVSLNNSGAGIFFVVNEGGHKDEDITRIRSVFIDIDQVVENERKFFEYFTDIEKIGVVPHLIVRSSPGKFHVYWKVSDLPVADFSAMQQRLAAYFESDPSVTNPSRVMRLPGFAWNKKEPGFFSEVVFKRDGDPPYSADQLRAAFPERQPVAIATGASSLPEGQAAALAPGNVLPFPAPAASPSGGVAMAPSTGRSVAMAFDATEHPPVGSEKLKEVEDALKYIPANKGFSNITQNNSLWRQVRMALKSQGEAGWELFNAWSQTATDGSYREQECRSEWENGLGKSDSLGPIFAEAQKRGWINPNSNAAKPVQQVPQSPWQLPQPAKAKPKLGITMINSIEQTEVKWLVEGLIPADANIGIVGASSVGKTFVALALGLSAATGREFMGGEMHCVAPVIYLAGEGKHGIAKRCRAWATYYGISLENVPFAVADYLPPMTDEESVAMTIEAVQGIKDHYGHPALIIIDTLNRAFGDEDENSTAGMTKYISGIDRLRAAFPGCSTVTLHHTGHEAVGRARGSSAFYAALDTELFIKRSDPWIEIEVTKQKDAAKAPKMKAWLREQDVGEWGSSLVAVRDMSINREMQISMAVSSGISVRQCVENLKKEGINISKNTIMKLRQEYEAQRNLNGV